jgi:periplasmic protein TonB
METKKKPEADLRRKSFLFFQIGMILALAAVITAFEWKTYNELEIWIDTDTAVQPDIVTEIQTTVQAPKPALIQPEIIEVEELDPDDVDEAIFDIDFKPDDKTVAITDIKNDSNIEEAVPDVFERVEVSPQFEGGEKAWGKYLEKNLNYPEEAQRLGAEGRIYVQFIVDTEGNISDAKVIKGVGFGLDEEALRVVKNAPKWKPGKQRGRPVKVKMVIPITFKFQ